MHPNIASRSHNASGSVDLVTGPGTLWGIVVSWDSTSNDLNMLDGSLASGTAIFRARRAALAVAADETQQFFFPGGIHFTVGLAYQRVNTIPNTLIYFSAGPGAIVLV